VLRLLDIVYSFDPTEAEDLIEAWCATLPAAAATETEGEWVRADIEEHVRDEHSTYTWLLEPPMGGPRWVCSPDLAPLGRVVLI